MRARRDAIQISERELLRLSDDVDQLHNDLAMPAMRQRVAELMATDGISRRRFLVGTGGVVGGLAVAACGGSGTKKTSRAPLTSAGAPRNLSGDLQLAATAASLEILAVQTYQAALAAAVQGKLGSNLPPALGTFSQTVTSHHQQHADAWNSILVGAGKAKVTTPDAKLKPQVDQQFAQVRDVPGLAKLALDLEDVAAATYLKDIESLEDVHAIGIAASIQPVELQHAAILHFVLGQYPAPDAFAKTDGARPPSDFS